MMQRKLLADVAVNHALSLIVAGGFCLEQSLGTQAAETNSYPRPPFSAYSSQTDDDLLGSSKYEKPVWNLHDTLGLPKWFSLSVNQRTRYESIVSCSLGLQQQLEFRIGLDTLIQGSIRQESSICS